MQHEAATLSYEVMQWVATQSSDALYIKQRRPIHKAATLYAMGSNGQ